jgi:hypothetical protein
MKSYFKNITHRAQWLNNTNKLKEYDTEMVSIYKNHFGKDYNKHFSKYMDKNKIYAQETHFIQIVDFLVLYYYDKCITNIATYNMDMMSIMTELSDMGYCFTENEAIYCIRYAFCIPHFKIIDKNSDSYKELLQLVYECFTKQSMYKKYGSRIDIIFIDNFDDMLLKSYKMIRECHTITDIKDLLHRLDVIPTITHFNLIIATRSVDYSYKKPIINFFKCYNIDVKF